MHNIETEVEDIFLYIRAKLYGHTIFKKENAFCNFLVKLVYKIYGKHFKNSLDYNYFAHHFNNTFFLKNLLKSLLFFYDNSILIENHIIDIGCGAAPSSIAIANIALKKYNDRIKVDLIDKSSVQLCLAKEFLNVLDIKSNSYTNFFDFNNESFEGLVVFSYFLCEQNSTFIEELYNCIDKFKYGFVVIDYKENINKLEKYFFKNNQKINIHFLHYNLSQTLSEILNESEIHVYGCYYKP